MAMPCKNSSIGRAVYSLTMRDSLLLAACPFRFAAVFLVPVQQLAD